jgi:transglutaminase-like putative cysteine protease
MKLNMKKQQQLSVKQLFWITASVIIAVLPHLPRLPVWFAFLLGLVVLVTWSAATKRIRPISGWFIVIVTISIFFAIIYFQGLTLNREISVTILTTMTVLKLLETHAKRDAWMIVTLCYFVMLTRFFYSQDLILLLYLIVSVSIITHSLFVLQHPNRAGFFIKAEIKQTLKLLMTGIPLAALFFLFFPRLGSPIWGSPDLFGEGKTGISEEMSPGSISQLFSDDSTAFRATFSTPVPPRNKLYWRGPVLWDFDGKTWRRNPQLNPIGRHRDFSKEGTKSHYEIELEPTGQHYLFALDYMLRAPKESILLRDSQLINMGKINQLRHYQVTSILKQYNPFEWLSNKRLARLRALPEGFNPKTINLVNSWKQINPDPEVLIRKTLSWFATDKFFYSYSPPLLQGDTVDEFLFETKSGFCEHYASAFTVMMRAAGIPSRIVTGYQGGINNGDYLLIKQSDAHAWSEVWIKDKGWIRVDPTAAVSPLRVEMGSQALMTKQSRGWFDSSWSRKMGEKYDAIRHKWNKWVRDYNIVKQKALFEVFGFDSSDGKSIIIVLGSIMLMTTLFVLLFLYWTREKIKFNHYDKIRNKFVKLFAQKGLQKTQGQGMLAFAVSANQQFPHCQQNIDEFTQLYLKLRFSNTRKSNKNLDLRLEKLIHKIKKNI